MRQVLITLLALIGGVVCATQAVAERRVALIVGNSQYVHTAALPNPRNDAQDMATSLRQLGFEVTTGFDLDQTGFARTIDDFARALDGADVGLFFYAGHGLQINEKNYLVSTSAKLESAFLVSSETIELDAIVRMMESKTGTNLIFLDACRNNPLADNLKRSLATINRSTNLGRGLARVEPTGRDTLVAFSAAPGQEAADGRGRNSPFTAALLNRMPQPGLEVSVMLKEVAADVRAATMNAQRPQQLSDMTKTFYFVKAEQVAAAPPATLAAPAAPALPAAPPPADPVDLAFWQSASAAGECETMRAYMRRFPNGAFADLARIAEQRLCAARDQTALAAPPTKASPPAPALVATPPALVATSTSPPPAAPGPFAPETNTNVAMLTPPAAAPAGPDVARELQRELLRVGCGVGTLEPDGSWNTVSREALRSFNERTRSVAIIDQPTPEALAAVRSTREPVCPAHCEPGMQMRGGSCVAAEPKAAERTRHASRPTEHEHERGVRQHAPRQADREPGYPRHVEGVRGPGPAPSTGGAPPQLKQFSENYFYIGKQRCRSMDHVGGAPRVVCP
jgi:uncharacterized caspase-like protein